MQLTVSNDMGTHMKTTVEIADPLFEQAKAVAERERTTLRALIEEGLRTVLAGKARGAKPFKLKDMRFKGGRGLRPDLAGADWSTIRRAVHEMDVDERWRKR